LLVVISVIALLAMMMFPSLGNIFGVARSTQCRNRLKEIGKAVELLKAQDGHRDMKVMFWQDLLRPYLGKDKSSLVCPEHAYILAMRGEEEEEIAPRVLPLEDLVAFRVNNQHFDDLGRGTMVVKLSDANFKRAKADGWLGNSNASNHFPRAQYEDGSEDSSNPYWLCLEDYGGDQDFKDVMVEVTITGNGYLLKCQSGFTGHSNWIVTKPEHEEIQFIGSNSQPGKLEPIPIAVNGVISSYGMNVLVPETLNTPGSILVLDYHWLLASTIDAWSDFPNPENNTIPVFARHRERVNVLFADGSVRVMDPNDIDPTNSRIEQTYWLP